MLAASAFRSQLYAVLFSDRMDLPAMLNRFNFAPVDNASKPIALRPAGTILRAQDESSAQTAKVVVDRK